jgi:AraC-like DNA-binding protein
MDLLWLDGTLVVAGPDRSAHVTAGPGLRRVVGLRFAPGRLPPLLGVPASALRDVRVELCDAAVGPTDWAPALRPDGEPSLAQDPLGAFESQLEPVVAAAVGGNPAEVRALAASIAEGSSVAAVAAASGYSTRQVHRRCAEWFGYGPSVLRRILRFDAAVAEHRRGRSSTWIAASHGYADASHLHRDVRELAGVPLSQLS